MTTIILTIHIIIAVALVGTVLLQRSEGGGLGIGGGGGGQGGGFMTARGTANMLTRLTAILAAMFFVTSITLAILSGNTGTSTSVVDEVLEDSARTPTIPTSPSVPTNQ